MNAITVITPYYPEPSFGKALLSLTKSSLVEDVVIVEPHRRSPKGPASRPRGATSGPVPRGPSSSSTRRNPVHTQTDGYRVIIGTLPSGETLNLILDGITTKYFLLLSETHRISPEPDTLDRLVAVAETTKAGLVYSDYYDEGQRGKSLHPLIDYQAGSVRDDFDFGAMILYSTDASRRALREHGVIPELTSAGPYDLRLKVSIDHALGHLAEPLYTMAKGDQRSRGETQFAYVDPRNRAAQTEMEIVFTNYLKKIGAYLPPLHLREAEPTTASFPVEASVVIPVRNREATIADAVRSALSQETNFPFNVIAVDNHSTDGTTAILSDLVSQFPNLKHVIPARTDLGIGGCWNEAIRSEACGRYAVQLDSDDLYSSPRTLQKMVDMIHGGHHAMVIGSYTLVDSKGREIPPGLIDHREWTDGNGHNNALRVHGLGAPRAFDTGLMRTIGFLNASYGEDYAVALRICREYRIGRIYESLYLCRRWRGNTDAGVTLEQANQNAAFKDKVRTDEIVARQEMNRHRQTSTA
jgi:hypothetical protein